MQSTKPLLILIVFLLASAVPAAAKNAWRVNETLLAATSSFEDMVDFALAQDDPGIARALAVADRHAAAVKAALPATSAGSFEELLQTIQSDAAGKQYQDLAVTATEAIRFLLDGLKPGMLTMPKEVNLLDYAGYRLRVLATATEPDWDGITRTAGEAANWWNAVAPKVTSKTLRRAFSTAIAGIGDATQNQDLPMLQLAAQMDLDLVKLLEKHFERK